MTFAARERDMCPTQRKPGQSRVVEAPPLPVICAVTRITALAIVAFVRVILLMTGHAGGRNVAIPIWLGMALGAAYTAMLFQQRKARLRMVILRYAPGLLRCVTRLAIGAEGATMQVIILVTTETGLCRVPEIGCPWMTTFALGFGMPVFEPESRCRVIKSRFSPAPLGMAVATRSAEGALMLVIGLVAGVTVDRQLQTRWRRRVAALAARGAVLAAQHISGIGVVVELRLPGRYAMTGFAALAQCTLVLVVLAVAADAGRGYALVFAAAVASIAFSRRVGASKFEAGLAVVIKTDVGPLADVVTRLALRPEPALVRVVLLVARSTAFRRIAVPPPGSMTALALHEFVRAIQPEFRGGVVLERRLVERCDAGVAPLVIGVTGAADRAILSPMQAAPLRQIRVDFLVAIEAQAILRCLVKRHVTTLALLLPLGVATNHLAWHERRFERLRAGRRACRRESEHRSH